MTFFRIADRDPLFLSPSHAERNYKYESINEQVRDFA